jgi:plastocyanin
MASRVEKVDGRLNPGAYPLMALSVLAMGVATILGVQAIQIEGDAHSGQEAGAVGHSLSHNAHEAALATTVVPDATAAPARTLVARNGRVNIVAKDLAFSAKKVTLRAGQRVIVHVTNKDTLLQHNLHVYDPLRRVDNFVGRPVNEGSSINYRFKAPGASGAYRFRCDYHPFMHGVIKVK